MIITVMILNHNFGTTSAQEIGGKDANCLGLDTEGSWLSQE